MDCTRTGSIPATDPTPVEAGQSDLREQLYNDGVVGPIQLVQLPLVCITSLHGVMLDIDPSLIRAGQLVPHVPTDPPEFYQEVVKPWIDRHPTLAMAAVRDTGSGVHVILRLDPPVPLHTDADRQRWAAIVQVIQSALPSDPRAPGITATTRALDSTNGKNGRTVRLLRPGQAIDGEELEQLAKQLSTEPFQTLFRILTGGDTISPCLKCKREGSTLKAGKHVGFCYSGCKKVTYDDLVAEVFE